MDGLDDFEKTLAAERAERDRAERHHEHRHRRKHKHDHDRDHDRNGRDKDRDRSRDRHGSRRDRDDGGHRHKRSRREDRHAKTSDPKEDLPAPDEEATPKPVRDAWMMAPSAVDVDYIHRPEKNKTPPKEEPKRLFHHREISTNPEDAFKDIPKVRTIDYTFGDAGSAWRMSKLRNAFTAAEESGRTLEDVALERFGDLQDFDDAREEKDEMERRKIYGHGYSGKEKPTGELYRERMERMQAHHPPPGHLEEQGAVIPDETPPPSVPAPVLDQTELNRLRAQLMKAKIRKAPNVAQLEEEYERASAAAQSAQNNPVVLGVMDSRLLAGQRNEVKAVDTKRGRERGNVEENTDMSIEDMVREERRTKGQRGGEGLRLAERIAKDSKYTDNLDYMDDNAAKLAKRVQKSEVNLRSTAVGDFQRMSRALDKCPLCHHEDTGLSPAAGVVSLGTRTFLTLPTLPEVSPGGAVIAPTSHRANLIECDDDEWEEIRNFMKSITRMYHDQGREVVFYENAAAPRGFRHAAMMAVPIPYEEGATAPAYFREAFLSSDEEWSQHRPVIDTAAAAKGGMGRMAFRRSIAKESPYFHVWFDLDGGLGHVVENQGLWPKGDLFAREVVAGIVGVEIEVVKKQGRWNRGEGEARREEFKKGWRKFDWTRMLAEE